MILIFKLIPGPGARSAENDRRVEKKTKREKGMKKKKEIKNLNPSENQDKRVSTDFIG